MAYNVLVCPQLASVPWSVGDGRCDVTQSDGIMTVCQGNMTSLNRSAVAWRHQLNHAAQEMRLIVKRRSYCATDPSSDNVKPFQFYFQESSDGAIGAPTDKLTYELIRPPLWTRFSFSRQLKLEALLGKQTVDCQQKICRTKTFGAARTISATHSKMITSLLLLRPCFIFYRSIFSIINNVFFI